MTRRVRVSHCSWSVCSLSRCGVVCAQVFVTHNEQWRCWCWLSWHGVGKEGWLSLQLVPHSMFLHGVCGSGSLIDFLQRKPADYSPCGVNEARLGFSLRGLEALVRTTSDEMAADYTQVERRVHEMFQLGSVLRVTPSVSVLRPCQQGFKP